VTRYCGALGCREDAAAVVDHPDHGEVTVCDEHAKTYSVLQVVSNE